MSSAHVDLEGLAFLQSSILSALTFFLAPLLREFPGFFDSSTLKAEASRSLGGSRLAWST